MTIGYSKASAPAKSTHMLSNPHVIKEIARLAALREKKLDLSADKTLQELARIAFFDPRLVVDWVTAGEHTQVTLKDASAISDHAAAAISEVKQTKDGISIKFHPKTPALAQLAKHHGLIVDKTEIDINVRFGSLTDDQLDGLEKQLDERQRSSDIENHGGGGEITEIDGECIEEFRPVAETA